MNIVAFGHRRRMGKSTAAKFLLNEYRMNHKGLEVSQFGFADKVKEVAFDLYSWGGLQEGVYYENHPELKESVLAMIGKSPRDIWIELGAHVRSICPKTWAELGLRDKDADVLICYDLRDEAEACYIRNYGGYVIKMVDPRREIFNDSADRALAEYDQWDGIIMNDAGLKELNQKIKQLPTLIANNERGWTI